MMIQVQTSSFLMQDLARMLPPLDQNQQERHRLERLADAAVEHLREPGAYSPASTPTTPDFHEHTFGHPIPANSETKSFGIPSVQSLFAIADGEPPRSYGFDPPRAQPSFRRPSTGSESSCQGSVPGLSRLSTASPSPRFVPRTPEALHSIAPQSHLKIDVHLGDLQTEQSSLQAFQDELQKLLLINRRRIVEPVRSRRPSSRQAPYPTATPDQGRRGTSNNRQAGGEPGTPPNGTQRPPHFNLRYSKSVKLFILYHKEDCGWGWKAINRRRVDLLPVLYREGYKPEVEENRQVAGVNGYYYRLNEIMPALTPDGSGLRFVEHDGRYWELTEPSKCREKKRIYDGRGKAEGAVDAFRPRGMVDRYPEEVVHHWDEFVKYFIPPDRHAEVYARAKIYCHIRAEQRREKGVPQWTPDNEMDRVKHTNPPDTASRTKRAELMQACTLVDVEQE